MQAILLSVRKKPSWSTRTAFILAAAVFVAVSVLVAQGGSAASGADASMARHAPAPPTTAGETQDEHPEWVLPYAASLGDFTAPAESPAPQVAAAPAASHAPVPLWLTGQTDLSPHAVVQTWQAYARTQGPSLDAMRELAAYAKAHPARTPDAGGQSVDAWLQAAAAAGPAVVSQMVAANYLDDRMARLFETTDAAVIADVVRDMDLASLCTTASCGSWRARYAMAYLEERAERRDPGVRCSAAPSDPAAAGRTWVVASPDPAPNEVARAMDDYLARQRAVTCATPRQG